MGGRTPKINDEIENLILQLRTDDTGNIRGALPISRILKERGIDISDVTVGKVLRAHREDRREALKESIREQAAPFIVNDLAVFDEHLAIIRRVVQQAQPRVAELEGERTLECPMAIRDYTALLREGRETAAERLKQAKGGDEPAPVATDAWDLSLLSEAELADLERLRDKADAGTAAQSG